MDAIRRLRATEGGLRAATASGVPRREPGVEWCFASFQSSSQSTSRRPGSGRSPVCGPRVPVLRGRTRPQQNPGRGPGRDRPSGDPLAAAGTTHSGACQGEPPRAVNTQRGWPDTEAGGRECRANRDGGGRPAPAPVWPPAGRPRALRSGHRFGSAATKRRRFAAGRRFAACPRASGRRFGHTGAGAGRPEPYEWERTCCVFPASPRRGRGVSGWIPRAARGRGVSSFASRDASAPTRGEAANSVLLLECGRRWLGYF